MCQVLGTNRGTGDVLPDCSYKGVWCVQGLKAWAPGSARTRVGAPREAMHLSVLYPKGALKIYFVGVKGLPKNLENHRLDGEIIQTCSTLV